MDCGQDWGSNIAWFPKKNAGDICSSPIWSIWWCDIRSMDIYLIDKYIYIHLIERFSYADFWTSLWLCRWVTDLKSKNLKTTFLRYSTVCCVQKFDGQNSHLTNHIFSQWPVLFMVKSSCFPANWPNGYKVMSHFQLVYATPSNKKCNHHKLKLFAFDIRQLSY